MDRPPSLRASHPARSVEVRGEDQFAGGGGPFQNPAAAGRRPRGAEAEAAVPVRLEDLYRAVRQIAGEDGAVARRVGYGTPHVLSPAFKRESGATPGRFRTGVRGSGGAAA
ncbi:hypothetical protein [Streptomyces sp. NBC_00631]|uniref:hypothetical protein n=1 Tax=Streptomyces sp. NBC_00631 TaxID=2975793 RepID=UPI00386CE7D3